MTSSELLHVKRAPTRLCECCELLLECLVSFLSLLFDSFVRFCVYFKTSSTRREARLPTEENKKKSTVGEISSLRLWLCFRAVDGLVSLFFRDRDWWCWSVDLSHCMSRSPLSIFIIANRHKSLALWRAHSVNNFDRKTGLQHAIRLDLGVWTSEDHLVLCIQYHVPSSCVLTSDFRDHIENLAGNNGRANR